MEAGEVVFKPSRGRAIIQDIPLIVVGYLVTAVLVSYLVLVVNYFQGKPASFQDTFVTPIFGKMVVELAPVLLLTLLLDVFDIHQMRITIRHGEVEGPSSRGLISGRVYFPISELDCERTQQVRWIDRVTGERWLVSKEGKKILVRAGAFTPHDLTRLMDQLGCVFAPESFFYGWLNQRQAQNWWPRFGPGRVDPDVYTLKPLTSKYFFSYLLLNATTWSGGWIMGSWLMQLLRGEVIRFDTLSGLAAVLLVMPIFALVQARSVANDTIYIGNGKIEGPPVSGRKRVTIDIAEIDRMNTHLEGGLRWIFGKYVIASGKGEKIWVNGWAFSRGQMEELAGKINC